MTLLGKKIPISSFSSATFSFLRPTLSERLMLSSSSGSLLVPLSWLIWSKFLERERWESPSAASSKKDLIRPRISQPRISLLTKGYL